MNAQSLASGHYARLQEENGQWQLLRGVDAGKDQSYMLSGLNQEMFAHMLLPLGTWNKTDIRQKARELGLEVAEKEDSQDLCFLGKQDYRDFLKDHTPQVVSPGNIVNKWGDVLGRHEGLAFYTIGQRKGLGLTSEKPLYVIKKLVRSNELVVGYEEELGQRELFCDHFNWISGTALTASQRYMVKIRYRADFRAAEVDVIDEDQVKIVFDEPLRDITPGQIAVVYDGDKVIGSGIIRL